MNVIASYTKEITDGEVVSSLSADQGITQYFKIYVPTRQTRLNVHTWGGTGNSDLVVYHESCRSYECVYSSSNAGNNEQVVVDAPATGWWYIRLYGYEAYSNVNLTADYFFAEELKDGDRIGPLSGNPGSTRYFRINVPEGQTTLEVRTWGGTGDCDLLVYHESCGTNDCEYSSSRSGNNEQVVVDNPSSGWWYIVLYSGRLAYSGVYLIADYSISIEGEGVTEGEGLAEGEGTIEGEGLAEGEGEGETITEIFDEQEVGPLSGTQGSYQYFKINVPAEQTLLDVRIWGGTGDCDLWVWHESCQTPDCRYISVNVGNNDEVLISNPALGWWYITLYGYSEYSGVYLVADYSVSAEGEGLTEGEGETIQEIFDEQIVGPLSSLQGIYQPFKINVPAGQVLLDVRIWGGTGDCDMWIYHESCQSSECVYHSIVSGNEEEIIVNNPTPGWWYIWLYASEAYDGVYLVADYSDSGEGEGIVEGEGILEGEGISEGTTEGEGLAEGEGETMTEIFDEQVVGPLSGTQGSYQPFKINVPAGQALLDVRIWGGTGDCDMWVWHESCQTPECRHSSVNIGNNDEVVINYPDPGWWYIWLYAYNTYYGVSLVADYSVSIEGEGVSEGEGEGETITEIFDEQVVGPLSGTQDSYQPFKINVPAGQALLDVRIWGGTGDCDMWIYHESCQSSECVYHSIVSGNEEEIIVNNPTPGWWYIWLYASATYDGVSLVADYSVSAEGEGVTEGEGIPEGTVEGIQEGTLEGEGALEGEGSAEGEGVIEGEGGEVPPQHSADPNGDGRIDLSELLRVIQFFNIGGYHCALPGEPSEDGYMPGYDWDKSCRPHASDYNPQDWRIGLIELLRLIQFFNMGGYHPCPDDPESEDGYCPGP